MRFLVTLMLLTAASTSHANVSTYTDLLIVGGTESGCAAAIQAARMGVKSITIVNDTEWLGGQFSSEALAAIDENRGPDGYGHGVPFPRNGLFKEAIEHIEAYNKDTYGESRPGNTRVITTGRPKDSAKVFDDLLAPYIASRQVRVYSNLHLTEIHLGQFGTADFVSETGERRGFMPYAHLNPDDADGDGIPDQDDALLFNKAAGNN